MKIFNAPSIKQLAIFIPTYGRAQTLYRVVQNIYENTNTDLFTIYVIAEAYDIHSIDAARGLPVELILNEGRSCYADAINTAYHKTQEPYFFTGADDLGFHTHWLDEAMKHMTQDIGVVGTNDLGNIAIGSDRDSTHYLVKRSYIQEQSGVIDLPDKVLYPYDHNYTDKEFIETAKVRGVFSYAPTSLVEHFHPAWGKAQMDDTYRKGLKQNQQDRQLFMSRQHLWGK